MKFRPFLSTTFLRNHESVGGWSISPEAPHVQERKVLGEEQEGDIEASAVPMKADVPEGAIPESQQTPESSEDGILVISKGVNLPGDREGDLEKLKELLRDLS